MGVDVANTDTSGVYAGPNAGQAVAREYCPDIVSCNIPDTSARTEVGYPFHRHPADQQGYTGSETPFDANDGSFNETGESGARTASVFATWSAAESFGVFDRPDLVQCNVGIHGIFAEGAPMADRGSTRPSMGAGTTFDVAGNRALTADYHLYSDIARVDGANDNVQRRLAGELYRF
jgi:hypothetical protein